MLFEVIASLLYFPTVLVNLIGLLFSFVFVLNLSSFSIIQTAENFVFNRYSAITRRIHLPKHRAPRHFTPSICFMGGGQLWMFAIGVGHYVYENFDIDRIKFFASSSGCFAAVPLACGLDPYDWCRKDWSKCIDHFESRGLLGCLYDTKHFYFNLWNEYLPEDAHIRCSGRLYISVTLFPSMKNRVISQFHSREDLIWAIVGSICLPFVFIRDFPVKCGADIGYVMDGGFSNDSPCLDSYTITVSALHRQADVKPVMSPHREEYYAHAHKDEHLSSPDLLAAAAKACKAAAVSDKAASTSTTSACTTSASRTSSTPSKPTTRSSTSTANTPAKVGITHCYATRSKDNLAASNVEATTEDEDQSEFENCDTDSSGDPGGNLLVEAAAEEDAEAAEESRTQTDMFKQEPESGVGDSERARQESAYKHSIRIRPIDIIRVPKYERVWEIGSMGQDSAAKCLDFERHEWASIRVTKGSNGLTKAT